MVDRLYTKNMTCGKCEAIAAADATEESVCWQGRDKINKSEREDAKGGG